MNCIVLPRILFSLLAIIFVKHTFAAEENFILKKGASQEVVCKLGPHVDERVTPCSTFKIILSLMGFDAAILVDENTPRWVFHEGYDEFLPSWKTPQTPLFWMKNSCIWYSRLIATHLGLEKMQNYLALFKYGNEDMSGGLTSAWISSSLKISPHEQVNFLQKMVQGDLPITQYATDMTKSLLFVEELAEGWKLYGKTGWGTLYEDKSNILQVGWFIGWIEKDQNFFPFAYNIREKKINLLQRIPRVKQLLAESGIMHDMSA